YFGPKNLIEVNSFLGGAALVLVLVAIAARPPAAVRRGSRGFWLGVAGVCVVLTYAGGFPLAAAQRFPVFSNNFVGRLRSLLLFALAVLVAIGCERVAEGRRVAARDRRSAQWIGVGVAAIVGAVVLWALAHAARAA